MTDIDKTPDAVPLIELYKVFHHRLEQEYELSWQQIKISIYLTGILVGGIVLVGNNHPDVHLVENLIGAAPWLGLVVAMGSMMTYYGSLITAKELRDDLGQIETELISNQKLHRYSEFKKTYSPLLGHRFDFITVGKFVFLGSIVAFWLIILFGISAL
jgi:hypothetical protein